jgi:hypothetical protein
MVFLLTFACYGNRLPGDQRGSVERIRRGRGGAIEPSVALAESAEKVMSSTRYTLKQDRASIVLATIQEVSWFRKWGLIAAHVRTTHVHVVVDLPVLPEKALADYKAYASRALNGLEGPQRRWARHGSTVRLVNDAAVRNAVNYVVNRQGAPIAVFSSEDLRCESPA